MPDQPITASKHLQWSIPGAFKRASAAELHRGKKPDLAPWLIAFGISAALLVNSALKGKPFLADNWPLSIAVALLLPAGFMFGIVWFSNRGGDVAIISEKGINHNGTVGAIMKVRHWPWSAVDRCELATIAVDGKSFRALIAHLHDGSQVSLAIADNISNEKIAATLQANGIQAEIRS